MGPPLLRVTVTTIEPSPLQIRPSPPTTDYSRPMIQWAEDTDFARDAGQRLEQAFVLCSFASLLVGQATE